MAGKPWNKGLSYTIAKREVYANKGTWSLAMRRMFGNACMRCGWDEAPTDTHHIIPKRDDGEMTMENGIILCPNCHRLAESGKIPDYELVACRSESPESGRRIGTVMPSEASQIDLLCGGFPERARTSALPAVAPDLLALGVDCSLSSSESLTLFDHAGSCLRMSPAPYRRKTGETWEPFSVTWPTSGTASGGEFSTHSTSECPSGAVECSLSGILEATPHRRYALSARAARGILRRAGARGRALPEALEAALVSLSRRAEDSETGSTRRSS